MQSPSGKRGDKCRTKPVKSSFATCGETNACLAANLMIKGLLMSGTNPTRAAAIKDLRGIKLIASEWRSLRGT